MLGKFCTLFLWIAMLTLVTWVGILILSGLYHAVFGMESYNLRVAIGWLLKFLLGSILMFLTVSPFAFIAQKTRGFEIMALNFIEILKAIFLGVVKGITEWPPISSTGHMLLLDEFITLNMSEAFNEMFFVVIQLGAIFAVVVMFWKKMFPFQFRDKTQPVIKKDTFSLWFKVVIACIPGGYHNYPFRRSY